MQLKHSLNEIIQKKRSSGKGRPKMASHNASQATIYSLHQLINVRLASQIKNTY
jgi:hypothetical protein